MASIKDKCSSGRGMEQRRRRRVRVFQQNRSLSAGPSRRLQSPPLPRQVSGRRTQDCDHNALEQDHGSYAVLRRRRPNRPHSIEITPRFVRLRANIGAPPSAYERTSGFAHHLDHTLLVVGIFEAEGGSCLDCKSCVNHFWPPASIEQSPPLRLLPTKADPSMLGRCG